MLANSPRHSLPFARMLAGLALVLTAAGCEMMTAGTNLVAIAASPLVTVPMSDGEKVPDVEMQFHGRWCGPNYPTEADKASGKDLTPVDRLDAACMKHDLCYAAHGGKPTCSCDVRDLPVVELDTVTRYIVSLPLGARDLSGKQDVSE